METPEEVKSLLEENLLMKKRLAILEEKYELLFHRAPIGVFTLDSPHTTDGIVGVCDDPTNF